MSLRIQQLYDYGKDRPVKFKDVDSSKFEKEYTVNHDGSVFKVYSYNPPKELVKGKYIKDKNHFNGDYEDAPIDILVNEGGDVVEDEAHIVNELYNEYGEGRFQVWKQGGRPPQQRHFKNKFIVKESGEEE